MIAALEVCFGHLRALFFLPFSTRPKGILISAFYLGTGFAHEAVIIFFVLSGFLISRSVYFSYLKNTWSAKSYAIDRITRLWIVIIPGLILTAIVDHIGLQYFHSAAAYSGGVKYLGVLNPEQNSTPGIFLGNIFFLQTITVNQFGTNDPLWSLANEFWYYVLFPLIYIAYVSKKLLKRLALLGIAVVICFFIGKNISIYFFIWLVGFAIVLAQEHFASPSTRTVNMLILSSTILFVFILILMRLKIVDRTTKDFMLAGATGVLIYGLIHARALPRKIKTVAAFLSGISFSLYVIHFPIASLLSAILVGTPKIFSLRQFLFYILAFLIVLILVTIFWYLFESRYLSLRAYLKKGLLAGRWKKDISAN